MIKKSMAALAFFASSGCFAEGLISNVDVASIRVDHDGKAYVSFSEDIGNTPASCVTTTYKRTFAFDTNTAGGRSILSSVLAAKASGAKVHARGRGSCTVWSTMEDAMYIIQL